ncbi:MAG: hypothetical protein QM582_02590 [Micropruina sp.]|uniref:hypothetical protein n=1 Tax=Micropruina sp. TaxID=2737536 RepID=UPI0039E34408
MRILLSTLIVCVLPLAGCTIGGQPSVSPPADTSSTTSAPASATPASTVSAQPSPTAGELPVIEVRKGTANSEPAAITLNEVAVRDGVTNVTFTLTNAYQGTGTPQRHRIQLRPGMFGDGQAATDPTTGRSMTDDLYAVDGVYLIDGVNKLRYLPARDSSGVCVCSRADSSVFLMPGQSYTFSVTFKAIPEGVETVGVSIPIAGTFSKVPVRR